MIAANIVELHPILQKTNVTMRKTKGDLQHQRSVFTSYKLFRMARQCSEPRPSGWGPRRPVWDQGCRPRTTLSTTPFAQLSRCLSPLSRPPVQMKSTPRSASRERKCSRCGDREKSGQQEERKTYWHPTTIYLALAALSSETGLRPRAPHQSRAPPQVRLVTPSSQLSRNSCPPNWCSPVGRAGTAANLSNPRT